MKAGADIGGTFTDLVSDDGQVAKVLSTPSAPQEALASGLRGLVRDSPSVLAHGTTVATNALLERRGGRVALVTNAGFADVIEIARQDRPSLYDQFSDRPDPLVSRELRLEIEGRLDAAGSEISPIQIHALPPIPDGVDAVAICLLHSDLNADHEIAVGNALEAEGHDISLSSQVSPEFREYERTMTTVVNAYLRPVCREYLGEISSLAEEVLVMTSAGGLISAAEAADLPAALLLSGPAGGIRAAAAAGAAAGFSDSVTLDMGGTSTDVCLVRGGIPEPAPSLQIGGLPVRLPSLDIHTIGAGGGSIARIDQGGALVVGPESAGANPGPVSYGLGGMEPTVTDANLVLGRIPPDAVFGELGSLEREAAARALDEAGTDASGVVAVVNANMERAIRAVTVERGHDPRDLALVAFGGAGPLHACELADSLGMRSVIIPPRAGVLSAVGLLSSPRRRELVQSWPGLADLRGIDQALRGLASEAVALVGGVDAAVETALDCRYTGQSHELTVPRIQDFHEEHRRRNGYAKPDAEVEVVAIRAMASRPAPVEYGAIPRIADRESVGGPAVIAEADCTIWVPDGWAAEPHPTGSFVMTRSET